MPRSILALILVTAVVSGLIPGGRALGGVERPGAPVAPQGKDEAAAAPAQAKEARKLTSFYTRLREGVLAKFRPVARDREIDFDAAEKALNSQTTIQQDVFNSDFERKMRAEYSNKVAPYEATATNPVWRPRSWEVQRYENGRKDLAAWTAREVLDDELSEFVRGGDQSSTPMKVLSTAHELSGGGDDRKEPVLTEQQKVARAHRTDLPAVKAEEEATPVKLKTKVNLIKAQGSVVFTNPIATTSMRGDKNDGLSLGMDREFRKLTLKSNLTYRLKEERLNLNVNKKITDQVSLDLDHANYTGSKRGSVGEKTVEQAKINYSISF